MADNPLPPPRNEEYLWPWQERRKEVTNVNKCYIQPHIFTPCTAHFTNHASTTNGHLMQQAKSSALICALMQSDQLKRET